MNFSLAFKTFGSCNNGQYFPKLLKANFLKNTPCLKKQQPYTVTQQCHMQKHGLFLVGAFSFKEKSPTITVASFFSFFFRQTTELIAYVPLFTETDKFTQAKFDQCKLTAKGPPFRFLPFLRNLQNRKTPTGPPFQFFFGTVRIFFSKIFNVSKESPLRIF